jgi:hypothetical protein
MPYGNINVDTVTTSTTGGILGAGNASIMKNRIINGAMVIDQRNAGASIATTSVVAWTYTLDRYAYLVSAASKFTIQQNAGSITPPVGFSNYLGCTSTAATSVGASDFYMIRQSVEGFNTADLNWGTADAKTVTLSFWVRSSLTGTFGGSVGNGATTYSYPFSYTISTANTWEQKSITIAGPTAGTWVGATNGAGMQIYFSLGMGSTYSATAGTWVAAEEYSATGATSVVGTNGATFYITGVQLEVGSSATGFEYVNYQTSLANCQRYFAKLNALTVNTSPAVSISFPTIMRTSPTNTVTFDGGTGATYANLGTGANAIFQNASHSAFNTATISLSAEL